MSKYVLFKTVRTINVDNPQFNTIEEVELFRENHLVYLLGFISKIGPTEYKYWEFIKKDIRVDEVARIMECVENGRTWSYMSNMIRLENWKLEVTYYIRKEEEA